MKIVNERPPIYDECAKVFPLTGNEIFCWGDTIYSPGGGKITRALVAHEATHSEQQGTEIQKWWDSYLADPIFRLEQEIAAHVMEYRKFRDYTFSRKLRDEYLNGVASRLCSPLYGNLIPQKDAVKIIRGG